MVTLSLVFGISLIYIGVVGLKVKSVDNALTPFSSLFYLISINEKILFNYLIIRVLINYLTNRDVLSSFSNHFLLTLDIIFFLSNLLIILINRMKIAKPSHS
ncbi:hypothetical protein [Sporosalibacterium faouarense]|uniref:hypothetical protein n=1 Tax=Sporosalibacterium faouarense TaxID=516123 RepID=UPI001A9CB2AD|nr:hypothetical protein [Sporosalibacterium faouarense]